MTVESQLSSSEDEQGTRLCDADANTNWLHFYIVVTREHREEITEVVVVPQVSNVVIETEIVREVSLSSSTTVQAPVLAQEDSSRAKWKEIASEYSPPIDIVELKDSYHVYAEVPGINVKDISIDLSDNLFTLTGDKRDHPLLSREKKAGDVLVQEINKGRFKRVLELPENVDTSDVDVEYAGGILQCKIRKLEERKEEVEVVQKQEEANVNNEITESNTQEEAKASEIKPKRIKGGKKRSSCAIQ